MAKKNASKPEEVKGKGQQGKKVCPGCKKSIGVRTQTCECGYEFRPKTAPAVDLTQPPQHLQAAMQFAAITGGFPAARQALNDSEAFLNQVEAWKGKLGGSA